MKNSDNLTQIWYENPLYYKRCNIIIDKLLKELLNNQQNQKSVYKLAQALGLINRINQSDSFFVLLFLVSILMRLICIGVIVYVVLIMINETDSWIPLANLVFCFGIFIDMIYFIRRKKEHTG
jgi:hypothetical protein